jgi:DNA-binding transcriptional LysR family regulator
MNEREIKAFRATARLGTVTRAAESLHVTQPAVSRLLFNLEARIGLTLFSREKKRLKLTAEGQSFLREVEQHFIGIERLEEASRRIAQHGAGALRILGIPSITSSVLPQATKRLLSDHPKTIITLDTDTTDRIASQIENGGYDVGFSTHPVDSIDAVSSRVIAFRPWTCVFPIDSPYSNRYSIELRELIDVPLVGFSPGMSLRVRVDNEFAIAGVTPNYVVNAQTIESICALVSAGCGAAIIHPFARHIARMHELKTIEIKDITRLELLEFTSLEAPSSMLLDRFLSDVERLVNDTT